MCPKDASKPGGSMQYCRDDASMSIIEDSSEAYYMYWAIGEKLGETSRLLATFSYDHDACHDAADNVTGADGDTDGEYLAS